MTTFLGYSLPPSSTPRVVYCDKSYKKLHSCHFSRNESSRKIFLRHHCQSCESLWKKEEEEKEGKREKKLSLSILDLSYIRRNQKCGIKLNDLIKEEKKKIELNETKNRDFDPYIFNNN